MRFILNNKGYAAIVGVLLSTTIGLIIVSSITSMMINRDKVLRNVLNSAQSYYTAESGIEDMLLRMIDPNLSYTWENTLSLAGATTTIGLGIDEGVYIVQSFGDKDNFLRGVQVGLVPATEGVSFNYGVQVGQGGLEMKNSGRIEGNVYSDGDIIGTNSPTITGDAWASGNHEISGIIIGADAHANTLDDDDISGDAYYQSISGSSVDGTSYPGSPNPPSQSLPITEEQIDNWKGDAAVTELVGNYTLDGSNTVSLGPVKIVGNLEIKNSAILTVDGTIWVTGNVTLQNNAVIQLNDNYGANSGIIIADGKITVKNDFKICGSEGYNAGTTLCYAPNDSYLLLLSTKDEDEAISLENNTIINGIIYTSNGEVSIKNSARVKAVVGYEITVQNNIVINYETGLVNLSFSSGPGGGWIFEDWKEVIQ